MRIPRHKWVWCGVAGHFVGAKNCRFHLNTRVGDYRVSTVGDYHPRSAVDGKPEQIGCDRLYETFVFRVKGEGECGAGEVVSWSEVDSEGYNSWVAAELGHMAMCSKYAEIAATEKALA